MRKPHTLTSGKGVESPRFVVYFDSESTVIDNIHHPYLVCATFKDRKRDSKKTKDYIGHEQMESFWKDVTMYGGKRTKVYVYAHNIGYDVINTRGIPSLVNLGFRVASFFEKGTAFIMELAKMEIDEDTEKEKRVKTIILVSSTNYFSTTLKKLGETFNFPKIEVQDIEKQGLDNLDYVLPYCRRDTDIVEVAMESFFEFVEREGLGTVAKTIAGQSFNAFRFRFMREEIFIHSHVQAIELERSAYSGGRVECFKIGRYEGNYYYYDVNSMYPHVMKNERYPVKLKSYVKRSSIGYMKQLIEQGYLLIAKVKVKTDNPIYPLKLNGSLIFPIGEYWTTLSTPEIVYGLEKGLIVATGEMSIYHAGDVFVDYVDYFYYARLQAKARGDTVHNTMYKLFLNSLYGKFGQKSEDWKRVDHATGEEIHVIEVHDRETGEQSTVKTFGGSVFQKTGEGESFNSFPAVASHVTAYARMLILSIIQTAGWENVYYTDTDSVFVNEAGSKRLQTLVDPDELGKIKVEDTSNYIEIHAPKDYKFANFEKKKGVSKSAIKLSENRYLTKQWLKLNSFIRRGDLSHYEYVDREKVLTRQYNKAWVLESGEVVPFTIRTEGVENKIETPVFIDQLKRFQTAKGEIKNQYEIISKKFSKNMK